MKDNFPSWDREYALQRATAGPRKGRLLRQDVYKSNSEVFHAGGYVCESGKVVEIPTDDPMLDRLMQLFSCFEVAV